MTDKKNQYAKLVCLFLAEQLRIKKITLKRAADIAQKVLGHINLLDTEEDLLKLIKELSLDFEELFKLEERVFMWKQTSDRHTMEDKVREYVVHVIGQDIQTALNLLTEAVKEEAKLDDLRNKFPDFANYSKKDHA